MPLVNPAFQFPADWMKASVAIGVVRDADVLRFWVQPRKGEGTSRVISCEQWTNRSSEFSREIEGLLSRGAWLVAGLSPSRGLVRELVSPLSNPSKSAEIWPSLLEAKLPFSLEECAVTFLPPVAVPSGGGRCLAAAARDSDLKEAMEEWKEIGLEPDLLVPEVLLLSDSKTPRVWLGEEKTVCTAWHENRFLAAGGTSSRQQREKAVARFQAVWSAELGEIPWQQVGPRAEEHPFLLEQNAARTLFRKESVSVNLLEGPKHSRLAARLTRKKRTLAAMAGLFFLGVMLLPLWVRGALLHKQEELQKQMNLEYEALTGEDAPAGGHVLLASRYVEETLQDVAQAQQEVSGPKVSQRLFRVLQLLKAHQLVTTGTRAVSDQMVVDVLADEESLRNVQWTLERYGDEVLLTLTQQGVWEMEVKE